jgi:hypothetical protein
MTQFHEGQEVEIYWEFKRRAERWHKAKIVEPPRSAYSTQCQVEFPDGTRGVFDADHIRAVADRAADPHEFDRLDDNGFYHMT